MTLEIKSGQCGYSLENPIISDLNFRLETGEVMAVLGPNGCGKTTLLNTIVGINSWQLGQTLVHGRPLSDYGPRELWQQLGYVPQARTNVFAYTVMDMVLLRRSAHLGTFGRPGRVDRVSARRVLERLESAIWRTGCVMRFQAGNCSWFSLHVRSWLNQRFFSLMNLNPI